MKKRGPNTITKKKSLRAVFGTLMVVFAACCTSCQVKDGFVFSSLNEWTEEIMLGIKTERKQKDKVVLDIYAGHWDNFSERFYLGAYNVDPEKTTFAIQVSIRDNDGAFYSDFNNPVQDFLDNDKYLAELKGKRLIFRYSYQQEINLDEIPLEKGIIFASLYFVSKDTMEMLEGTNCSTYSAHLFFSKANNEITFSKKEFTSNS